MAHSPAARARWQATLAGIGTLLLWWRIGGGWPAVAAGVAGALALLAWLSPAHYAPVQRVLDRMLHAVLAGLTWFLLAVIYFGIFMPLRGWRALTGTDPLQRRPDPAAKTYFRPLPPAAAGRFDRQF
jgi:hypothetical protein